MKALSYIVASILMLIITVALSGTAYLYMSGIFTAGIQGIEIADAYCSLGEVTFKIKNIGTSDITSLDIEQTNPTDDFLTPSFTGTIEPGKTINYQDICTGEQSRKCVYRITPPAGKILTSEATCSGRPASLVLSLHFDEEYGMETADSSGKNNNGIFYGENFNDGTLLPTGSGPTMVNGKFGKALSFNGVDEYVELPSTPSTAVSEFTVGAWVFIRSFNTGADLSTPIVSDWNTWDDGFQKGHLLRAFHTQADGFLKWAFYVADGTNYQGIIYDSMVASSFSSKYANKWLHLAGVFENGILRLYIDGKEVSTFDSALSQMQPEAPSTFIGYSGINAAYTNGIIDEVRIFDRALSKEEIQAEMQSSKPIIRSVAAWSFEDTDMPGYANDTHIWVKGEYGSALGFDGVDDYVEITSTTYLSEYTISFRFNLNSTSDIRYQREIGLYNLAPDRMWNVYTLRFSPYPTIFEGWRNDGSNFGVTIIPSTIPDTWYYAVVTYDGTTYKTYVDDGPSDSRVDVPVRDLGEYYLWIGSLGGINAFGGIIDEVKIYNKVLI